MIAYHFPPFRGSSGMERTLSFCRNLPSWNWRPVILTVKPRAFPDVGEDRLGDIPEDAPVARAFALDTARHLSAFGRYLRWMALPDRWVTWSLGGIPLGLNCIRKYRPRIIWSTYPIATAHLIGYVLHRLTGIPWVADFRDPMVEFDPRTGLPYPLDPWVQKARLFIERLSAEHASRVVFCTPGAKRICAERYPWIPDARWVVVANGYDEHNFRLAERSNPGRVEPGGRVLLLHSGLLYFSPDRDPTAFLDALCNLRDRGVISAESVKIVFRGTGHDDIYRRLLSERNLQELVFLEPLIPYRAALAEMLNADGLLIFQGYPSNPAIPAKLYEYLRARRPILAMTDAGGDTAGLLRSEQVGTIVPLDSAEQIAAGFTQFLQELREPRGRTLPEERIKQFSRESRTRELAALFDDILRKFESHAA